MKGLVSIVLTLAMTLSLLAGCGSSSSSDTTSSSGDTSTSTSTSSSSTNNSVAASVATEVVGDGSEKPDGVVSGTHLDYYITADATALQMPGQHTGGSTIYAMVYDTLFWSPDGSYDTIEGLVAKDWTISDDELVWTINIHEDIYFENGRNMTAESIVGAFDILQQEGQAASFNAIEGYEATDTYELTITFKNVSSEFMYQFTVPHMSIFDPTDTLANGVHVDNMYQAGSGPYWISDYSLGEYITFTAREDYWNEDRVGHIETITCWIMSNSSTHESALTTGEVLVGGLSDYNTMEALLGQDHLNFYVKPDEVKSIWINTNGALCEYLTNARVREALCMMINMEEVTIADNGDWGHVVNGVFAETIDYEHDRVYDPEGALAILAEEGIDPSDIVLTGCVNTKMTEIFTNLQAQFALCGVTLDFQTQDTAAAGTMSTSGQWDLLVEHGGVTPYVFINGVQMLFGEGGQYNICSDPELDPILEELSVSAFTQSDHDDEMDILAEMSQILDENYLYLGTIAIPSWMAADQSVQNFVLDGNNGYWRTWDCWLSE